MSASWPTTPMGPADHAAPLPEHWDGTLPEDLLFMADPHGWGRLLARREEVHERPAVTWILRHRLVEALVKHPCVRQFGVEIMALRGVTEGPLFDWWQRIVLTANGDHHVRLRMPLQRTFSFPLIARLRPRIRELARELIREINGRGEIDFLEEFASQLPVRGICDVLGVPREDIPLFKRRADKLGKAFGMLPPEEAVEVDEAIVHLSSYVQGLVAERRKAPGDDFLSQLIATIDETNAYSEDELVAQILGLIFAGSDTTRTAIAVAVALLLQHQDQWALLKANPDLVRNTVDETMRFEPTVGHLPRVASEDFEIEGHRFVQDQILVMSISAAQRDPERYPDPDRFNIAREDLPRQSIGFGGGPHRCLGEALARSEIEEALMGLIEEIPHLEPAGPLPHFEALATGIRKLTSLRVRT